MAKFTARVGNRPAIGCTLGFGAVFSAQLIARVGYDWVLIDMEHNPISASQAAALTHAVIAASAGRCSPLIRVPSQGMEWIKWALDCGSHGVVVPMVQCQAEAEAIVRYGAYPPLGQRSFGPTMAAFADLDPSATTARYKSETSKNVQIIPMIESTEGVNNAEAICSVEGVTAVFVGPVDLRLSMGLPGGDGEEPEYLNAIRTIVRICKELQKPVGIFAAGEDECRKRASDGFDFILVCYCETLGVLMLTGVLSVSWGSCTSCERREKQSR